MVFGLFEAGSARTDIRYTATSGTISFQNRTASGGGVTKTSVTTTSYRIFMGRRSGTTQAIEFNNSAEITNTSGADENGINTGHIGSFLGTSFWFDGQIAEILVFNSSLSSGDITKVNNYLSKKWAISI